MRTTDLELPWAAALLLLAWSLQPLASLRAASTIDSVNRYAYGANLGWTDWYADGANGAFMGEYVCSGYIYAANVGWINLGSGAPANGIQYQNNSATDFGVNQDGLGNLRGYAYGANIGWLNFENSGAPKINMLNGQLSGYLWSANCGWISLSNAVAFVQTDTIPHGTLAPNGLPIAWLLTNFGTTNVNANADPTGKGMTIAQDYLAGTAPNNYNDILRITAGSFSNGGVSATLTWNSVGTRYYAIRKTPSLSSPVWTDSGLGLVSPSGGSTTTAGFTDATAPLRFYRVEAVRPLTPPATEISFLAASGDITSPFVITNGYIYQPIQTTVPANGGRAAYTFTNRQAGTYVIQVLVNAPNEGANSVFVNIDAEPQAPTMISDIYPLTAGFEERTLSWRGTGGDINNQFIPNVFTLTQGTHQLIIRGREANTLLQSISILPL